MQIEFGTYPLHKIRIEIVGKTKLEKNSHFMGFREIISKTFTSTIKHVLLCMIADVGNIYFYSAVSTTPRVRNFWELAVNYV